MDNVFADLQFDFAGRTYTYFDVPKTRLTERRMEMPLGATFARKHQKNMLEVGNVTRHHCRGFSHPVIDLYEKMPRDPSFQNIDVFDYEPPGPLAGVLSISTLEHTADPERAIRRILEWAPNVLITAPMGTFRENGSWCTTNLVKECSWPDGVGLHIMQRITEDNRWKEISREHFETLTNRQIRYGRKFPFANIVAVWIKGTF